MFNLELDSVIAQVKKEKAKRIVVQLPDGLKPRAQEISERIEKETGATVITWFGSCFGACDIPIGLNTIGVDMLVQFGHNQFNREKW